MLISWGRGSRSLRYVTLRGGGGGGGGRKHYELIILGGGVILAGQGKASQEIQPRRQAKPREDAKPTSQDQATYCSQKAHHNVLLKNVAHKHEQ